jgi:tetratricopeptide (TPR) repeat protein
MFKFGAYLVFLAATVAVVTPTVPAMAKAAEAPKGKPSKGMNKIAVDIQTLAAAKDWVAVKTKLVEAEVIPDRNSFDSYFISQYRYNTGIELKDNAMMMAGLEGMVNSEFIAADQKPKILRNLLAMSEQSKNTPKALAYAQQYLTLVPDDMTVQLYVIEQMQRTKDYAGAETRLAQLIATAEASGKPIDENIYLRLAIGREQSKSPKFPEALTKLVSHYPTARNWNFLLENFQTRTGMIGRAGIDLFRLMNATGALTTAGSVIDAAQTALDAGVPGDAKTFVEKAQGAGIMADRKADAATTLKAAQTAMAAEEPAAKQEAAATTGDRLAAVGQLYLSTGNYAKANDVFGRALAKGVRNKNETLIRSGIAKIMNGDAAAAKSTWAGVAGDAKLAELAQLWTLYANGK